MLLASVTPAPPAGAGPLSVTVAVDELPPTTLVGFKLSEEGVGALTVRFAVRITALYVAEIEAVVVLATAVVVTGNVAVVAPAATVTLGPTWAAGLLLASVITAPPAAARPVSVTVPVEELPPTTVAGLRDTVESDAGLTVNPALFVVP